MAPVKRPMNRSELMSRIRGRGNLTTEQRAVTLFRQDRMKGWRRRRTFLEPGGGLRYVRPDFVFAKERVMVMIDGCFWHGCPACYRQPKSNLRYWLPKIEANRHRDRTANQVLRKAGWTV